MPQANRGGNCGKPDLCRVKEFAAPGNAPRRTRARRSKLIVEGSGCAARRLLTKGRSMKSRSMKSRIVFACLALFFVQNVVHGFLPREQGDGNQSHAFTLAGIKYFHRFTKADQHEYTPDRQEDLKRWTDMVTINYYRQVRNGEALASAANSVLENYKANKALVIKTDSVPRTRDKPAEHLIVVLFPRADFIEASFARFRLHNGVGVSVVYSHRIYGNKSGNEMSAWLEKNGPATEQNLLKWDAMPKPPAAR